MSLIATAGTITALGQSQFNNQLTIYAYIEVTQDSGRRVIVEGVAVRNDVAPLLQLGVEGEFYFDRMLAWGRNFRAELWGLKLSDGRAALQCGSLRTQVTWFHIVIGILLLPFFFGPFFLALGLGQLIVLFSLAGTRRRMFYGENRGAAASLTRQQAIRI